MIDIKLYFWMIPFVGVVICSIALFTPAAFFENQIWNHTIYVWIWGYNVNKLVSVFDQSVSIDSQFYSHSLQLIPSLISSSIIIISIIIIAFSVYKHRKDFRDGKIKITQSLIPVILIIISTIIWMLSMEIAELSIYDLSMWDRYIPNFGVIGMFLGAGFIITGFIVIKKFRPRD